MKFIREWSRLPGQTAESLKAETKFRQDIFGEETGLTGKTIHSVRENYRPTVPITFSPLQRLAVRKYLKGQGPWPGPESDPDQWRNFLLEARAAGKELANEPKTYMSPEGTIKWRPGYGTKAQVETLVKTGKFPSKDIKKWNPPEAPPIVGPRTVGSGVLAEVRSYIIEHFPDAYNISIHSVDGSILFGSRGEGYKLTRQGELLKWFGNSWGPISTPEGISR